MSLGPWAAQASLTAREDRKGLGQAIPTTKQRRMRAKRLSEREVVSWVWGGWRMDHKDKNPAPASACCLLSVVPRTCP